MKARIPREGKRLAGPRAQAEGLALSCSGSGAAWMDVEDSHGLVGLGQEAARGRLSWLLFSLGMMSQGQPKGRGLWERTEESEQLGQGLGRDKVCRKCREDAELASPSHQAPGEGITAQTDTAISILGNQCPSGSHDSAGGIAQALLEGTPWPVPLGAAGPS